MTVPRTRRRVVTVLRTAAAAAVALAVVARLGPGAVLDGVRAVSPGALAAALGLGLVTTAASAARWCVVARGIGLGLGFGDALRGCYRAQFLNAVLPVGVLGDVHRAVDSGRRSGELGRSVRAVVLERVAGQVVVVLVGIAVLLVMPGPVEDLAGGAAPTGVVVAGVAAVLLGLAAVPPVRRGLAALAVGAREAVLTARAGPAVAGLSLLAMAGHLALLAVAASAVGVQAAPDELVPLLVLSLLAMGVPVTVGGWGPREATTTVAFGAAGLGADTGLATSVAFGVLALVSTLPGLVVLVRLRGRPPTNERRAAGCARCADQTAKAPLGP